MNVTNKNRVPKRQWRKWRTAARATFNGLYHDMMQNPGNFSHPRAVKQKPFIWKTTAWNSAWMAADYVELHTQAAA